jgi:hypothetical protein
VTAGEPKSGSTIQHELVATVTGSSGVAGVVVLASKDGKSNTTIAVDFDRELVMVCRRRAPTC